MEALLSSDDAEEREQHRAIAVWLTQFQAYATTLRDTKETMDYQDKAPATGDVEPSGSEYMRGDSGDFDDAAVDSP